VINTSIHLGLIESSRVSLMGFLGIDEGFSCMDATNREKVGQFLRYLSSKFDNILMISHLEDITSVVDMSISIESINGTSHVCSK